MLQVLTTHPDTTLDSLSRSLQLSKSSTKRIIDDINFDLAHSTTLASQVIKQEGLYILSCQNSTDSALVYHSLKLFYLNDSVSFRLLVKLSVDFPSTIPSIRDSLYISTSHFYRTVTSLTTFP